MSASVNLSLMEQLRISERDVQARKEAFHLEEQDAQILAGCKRLILRELDWIVDQFYQEQINNREVALLIGDKETLARLKDAQRHYIVDLFSGVYDAAYVNSRLRVGKVHKRIGVTPVLYMSAAYRLLDLLKQALSKGIDDKARCRQAQESLLKLMLFDIELVFETYISSMMSELTSAREELEHYAEGLAEEVAQRTQQLEELSSHDALTGLVNQRSFYEELRRAVATAERSATPLALAYMDLNSFKPVNDTLGHLKGDEILRKVGQLMQRIFRESDILARYGGDEFCVIMPGATIDEARKACDRLMVAVDQTNLHGVTIAIGLSQLQPGSLISGEELLREADKAMYQAKERAHNTPTVRGAPSSQVHIAS